MLNFPQCLRRSLIIPAVTSCLALAGEFASSVAADKTEPVDIGSRRELFIDDHLIETLSGAATRHLHQPEAKEVVLTTDAPWEGNISAYYTIFQDDDVYRMYYRGSHWDTEAKKATHREVTCYAESADGIHWTKPDLGLFEFNGSRQNNIVLDGLGTHCFAAFRDDNPDCPPEARYKGMSYGRSGGKKGLFVFHSPDGLRWSQMTDEPVITKGAFDSQNLAFWDTHAQEYREYHRIFVNGVRAIMTGSSRDFLNWSDPVLLEYQAGAPDQHLYTNAVLPYQRAPHLLLGFPTRYLPKEGQRVEPTLMISRDRRHFYRWLEAVIPETAPEDRGGNRSNYMAWGLLDLPDRPQHFSVYASEAYYTGPDSRLRRFEYRKDGFVSIRADQAGGHVTTKTLTFDGTQLSLNYATSGNGQIRVALLDDQGESLEGFSVDDCEPLVGDHIDGRVQWKGCSIAKRLIGQPVRVHIELRDADLYSIQFARQEP